MSGHGAPRSVMPEMLDELAPEDPVAQRSRRDLRRVNWLMGSVGILSAGLRAAGAELRAPAPLRLLELGAGDGELMLRVAKALTSHAADPTPWRSVELWLLDRQALVATATIEAYARVGWSARPLVCDVRAWAEAAGTGTGTGTGTDAGYDVIVANLFLHHLESPALTALLRAAADRCRCFLACEPRRSGLAALGSHLLGVVGANRVTRHDAVRSVQAGFRGQELSEHWPRAGWQLQEHAAGLFSHLFSARRAVQSAPPHASHAPV